MTELEKSIKILMEHTQHFVPTEDLEHLYSVIETAEKVSKYENAEEEGRMAVLPCKVGDTVYVLRQSWNGWNIDKKKFTYGMMGKVGKKVFLTRDEAEKALKEMEVKK